MDHQNNARVIACALGMMEAMDALLAEWDARLAEWPELPSYTQKDDQTSQEGD